MTYDATVETYSVSLYDSSVTAEMLIEDAYDYAFMQGWN
jgi:hypothetical protein